MRAIILAAGEGTRLRPYTDTIPKCMVPYKGKPIIEYTIECLYKNNITDISAVVGYQAQCINRYSINTILNPRFNETNMVHSLFCAERLLNGEDDVLIIYGDIVFDDNVLKAALNSSHHVSVVVDTLWAQLWEMRMENIFLDAETLKLRADGSIKELGKKPTSKEDIQGQYIGLIKIKKESLAKITDLYHSLDKTKLYDGKTFPHMFMTSFIQQAIDAGIRVNPVWIDGGWLEFDRPSDLDLTPINIVTRS